MTISQLPPIDLSGTCDAKGNCVIPFVAPPGKWTACYLAMQTSAGSPQYVVAVGPANSNPAGGIAAQPRVFGSGLNSMLGPLLLASQQWASIAVSGANAAAAVGGQVIGWQADTEAELAPTLPTPATVSGLQVSVTGGVLATMFASTPRVTGNGTTVLVAPVSSKNIFIFGWTCLGDGGVSPIVAGVLARIVRHSDGALIGGLAIEEAGSPSTQVVATWSSGYHGGAALGVGDGIDLIVDSQGTGAGLRASVSYTQQ